MKIGAIVPQGWVGEHDGWEPLAAWRRTTEVALQAERLGFESIWLFDHVQTTPRPTDEITFESFTSLSALAALTSLRVSVHLMREPLRPTGAPRIDLLAAYRDLGVSRVMGLNLDTARTDEALESLAEDARAAGLEIDRPVP